MSQQSNEAIVKPKRRPEKIYLRVTSVGLAPADPYAETRLREKKYKPGDILSAQLSKLRKQGTHKNAHKIGVLMMQAHDDFRYYANAHDVLKRLQVESGAACEEIKIKKRNGEWELHRYWQLIIIDEAAGVPDDHFDVIDGTQTQPGNRTLLASQGVRNAGRFYETQHNLSKTNGGSWANLRFSSERSPFVTLQWLKDREDETGGKDSIEYKIRVRGLFAEDSGSNLLSRSELERAFEPRKIIQDDEAYGLFVLADVGLGEYRDESVAVVAKVVGYGDFGDDARRVEFIEIPYCTNSKNEIIFAGDLVNLVGKLSNATLLVDNGGVGATVNKLIEASGVPVVRVNWGKPCFKKEYQDRFYNRRACAMVRFRDAVRSGRVVLPQNIDRKLREKILLQGARLPYHFAEAGGLKYVMEKKEEMRKQGIKSPDIIDAMSFVFLEDAASYMVSADAEAGGGGSIAATAQGKVDDMFAEV